MARKSSAQRYSEMDLLIKSYSDTERQFFSWDIKFMSAMMVKIQMKKALTKKMRAKIDDIIALGKKSLPEKTPRIIELESAIPNSGQREQEVLKSFIYKLFKGWSLSEGQEKFANSLVEQANRAPWTPSEEDLKDISIILEVARTYDRIWFGNNPSASSVLQNLQSYVSNGTRIQESDLLKAKKKFSGGYKKIKYPKFVSGDRAFIRFLLPPSNQLQTSMDKTFCLVIEGPYVKGREIVNDIMVNGSVMVVSVNNLYKRK